MSEEEKSAEDVFRESIREGLYRYKQCRRTYRILQAIGVGQTLAVVASIVYSLGALPMGVAFVGAVYAFAISFRWASMAEDWMRLVEHSQFFLVVHNGFLD